MIISAQSGARGLLVNADTGELIRKVVWANLETGEFEAICLDGNGETIKRPDGKSKTYKAKARIRFVPTVNFPLTQQNNRKPKEQPFQPRRVHTRHQRIKVPLLNLVCGHPGCSKTATWMTSDEEQLTPEVVGSRRFDRAKHICTNYWCSWHYQPPRLFDAKGELISTWEEAGGVRPQ